MDKNSISMLKEYHDRTKRQNCTQEPSYVMFSSEIGGGFNAQCVYNGFTVEGTGSSKSIAKCEAARKMLLKLNLNSQLPQNVNSSCSSHLIQKVSVVPSNVLAHPAHTVSSKTEKLANKFIEKYSNSERLDQFTRYPPNTADLEVCFSDINFGMKSPSSPKSETLLKRLDEKMHLIECFEKVMGELNMKFCCEQIKVDPDVAGKVYVVLLKINFNCMVVGGTGESIGQAVENACRNGLDTFRLYMK